MKPNYSPITTIQAMKVSLVVQKEKSIESLMSYKWITRKEAIDLIDKWKGDNNDFYNWWNVGSLHWYMSALDDIIESIKEDIK